MAANTCARSSTRCPTEPNRETLAVITLRMGGAEMQAGVDAAFFQHLHQTVGINVAPPFVDADDKQMLSVAVFPSGHRKRRKRRIG
ncbi:MAG: hypothetical protein GPOALKHO_001656 [Sodalis sp.]|nr:MAG: hypothetical protein GPOALKHO_001656 [Sodalis sp.]